MSELTAVKMREVWQMTKPDEHEWLDSFALEHWPVLIAAVEERDNLKDHVEALIDAVDCYYAEKTLVKEKAARVPALEAEVKRLKEIAGLRSNAKLDAVIRQHISDGYRGFESDSCGSCVHQVYEMGDALNGPAVVVRWPDKQVWFSMNGDEVEIDTFSV